LSSLTLPVPMLRLKGRDPATRAATREQSLREQAEKDPTVKQMLRTFLGEIVDVKRADGKQ